MNEATRAFWNAAYQMSAFLPDADDWPPRYAELSAAAIERRQHLGHRILRAVDGGDAGREEAGGRCNSINDD